jgi:hypothetical protein
MKTLARTVSLLAFIALLAMLGLHALAALFWGAWDHEALRDRPMIEERGRFET